MGLFFVYILKSSLCLAVFYLFYRLLLSRETFHRFNRFALLGTLLFSCLLPLVEISVEQDTEVHQTMMTLEQWLLLADATDTVEVQTPEFTITWIQVALLLYLAGIIFFAVRNVYSLTRLVLLLKSGKRMEIDNYVPGNKQITLIVHDKSISPFSWMKYVVISQKDLEENGREILIHELAHINSRHSLDLLVADVCIFFQWFSPASWLLKQELQNIHEFEADEAVIKQGVNAKQYQLLLIKKAVGTRLYSMANSFNHSKLKKRITMMLKEKSSPWARLKYFYVLPLAAVAITAFARPEVSKQVEEISRMSDAIAHEQVNSLLAGSNSISAAKVNYLAAISEVKAAESVPTQPRNEPTAISEDTVRVEKSANMPAGAVRIPDGKRPLCIINGKEADMTVMQALRADAIESISVLKEDTAIQQYGEKGKNGVILITLKDETPNQVIVSPNQVIASSNEETLIGRAAKVTVNSTSSTSSVTSDKKGIHFTVSKENLEDLTVYIDDVKIDLKGRGIDDLIPADQIESLSTSNSVNVENGVSKKSREIRITTKKNAKGMEKISVKGWMTVEGHVKDKKDNPIVGASVLIAGTTTGTITDANGKFTLPVSKKDADLLISYIGMKTVKAKAKSKMNIVLKD